METNVDCWSLNPDGGHLLAWVHLERAWLCGVYGCRLVIICRTIGSIWVPLQSGERRCAHSEGHKSLALVGSYSSALVAVPCGP